MRRNNKDFLFVLEIYFVFSAFCGVDVHSFMLVFDIDFGG